MSKLVLNEILLRFCYGLHVQFTCPQIALFLSGSSFFADLSKNKSF